MLRWLMFLMALIASLAGSPLRHAEAAEDLERFLTGLHDGRVIEAVDGGVGDDSGATVVKATAVAEAPPMIPVTPEPGFGVVWGPVLTTRGAQAPPPCAWMADEMGRRCAWLQRFRF